MTEASSTQPRVPDDHDGVPWLGAEERRGEERTGAFVESQVLFAACLPGAACASISSLSTLPYLPAQGRAVNSPDESTSVIHRPSVNPVPYALPSPLMLMAWTAGECQGQGSTWQPSGDRAPRPKARGHVSEPLLFPFPRSCTIALPFPASTSATQSAYFVSSRLVSFFKRSCRRNARD